MLIYFRSCLLESDEKSWGNENNNIIEQILYCDNK